MTFRARARICASMENPEQNFQMEIFSPAELNDCIVEPEAMSRIRSDEQAGRYTAGRLRKLKPALYNSARALLSAGMPMCDIARILGVHFYTVSAIAESEADFITKAKESLAKKAFAISAVALEKVMEAMPKISISKPEDVYKVALTAANLVDKGQLLSGGATQRVETRETKTYSSAEDFEADVWDADAEIVGE